MSVTAFCAARRWAAMVSLCAGLSGCGLLSTAGLGTPVDPIGGPCVWTDGFGGGTEDIAIDRERRELYVSADPRREDPRDTRGGIWRVQVRPDGSTTKEEVTGGLPKEFHPHGIDIWSAPGERRLFVINHAKRGASTVEVYRIEPDGRLTWLPAETSEPLKRPNDLVAVGPRAFYVALDRGAPAPADPARPSLGEMAEILLALPEAKVLFVRDGKAMVAAEGLRFPAGIAASPDRRRIFVGETSAGRIAVFDRLGDDRLELVTRYRAGPMPDNLTMAEDGLWYGAHSRVLAFRSHTNSPLWASPGRVEVMDPLTGERRRPAVLRERGKELSALSVGAPFEGKVVIGAIFRHRIGVCGIAQDVGRD